MRHPLPWRVGERTPYFVLDADNEWVCLANTPEHAQFIVETVNAIISVRALAERVAPSGAQKMKE
jgi:hypothetical protein